MHGGGGGCTPYQLFTEGAASQLAPARTEVLEGILELLPEAAGSLWRLIQRLLAKQLVKSIFLKPVHFSKLPLDEKEFYSPPGNNCIQVIRKKLQPEIKNVLSTGDSSFIYNRKSAREETEHWTDAGWNNSLRRLIALRRRKRGEEMEEEREEMEEEKEEGIEKEMKQEEEEGEKKDKNSFESNCNSRVLRVLLTRPD
jgi:hypothetical protein